MLERKPLRSPEKQEDYVANPLNAFTLLRRLQQDWPKWLAYLANQAKMEEMQKLLEQVPSEKDLKTAIEGLLRIESVYNLETSHMAKGMLLDKQYEWVMYRPTNLKNKAEKDSFHFPSAPISQHPIAWSWRTLSSTAQSSPDVRIGIARHCDYTSSPMISCSVECSA